MQLLFPLLLDEKLHGEPREKKKRWAEICLLMLLFLFYSCSVIFSCGIFSWVIFCLSFCLYFWIIYYLVVVFYVCFSVGDCVLERSDVEKKNDSLDPNSCLDLDAERREYRYEMMLYYKYVKPKGKKKCPKNNSNHSVRDIKSSPLKGIWQSRLGILSLCLHSVHFEGSLA